MAKRAIKEPVKQEMPRILKKVPFKLTKGLTLIFMEGVFIVLYVATMMYQPDQWVAVSSVIIQAMQWLAIGFMGLNVADNGVKGKYYQPDLDREYRCVD